METLDFTGLIVSRIAHEFAGPVSALENGATLLAGETDPDIRAEFTRLLGEAAAKLAARVRLHRLIFGTAAGSDAVSTAELRDTLEGVLDVEGRVALDWCIVALTLPRGEARLVVALVVLGADALPRGGTVTVANDATSFSVAATGPRMAPTADIRAAEGGANADAMAGSRAALGIFVRALAARLPRTLDISRCDGGIRFTAGPA